MFYFYTRVFGLGSDWDIPSPPQDSVLFGLWVEWIWVHTLGNMLGRCRLNYFHQIKRAALTHIDTMSSPSHALAQGMVSWVRP